MSASSEFWKDYFSYWEKVIRDWCDVRGKFDSEHENIFDVQRLDPKEIPEPYICKVDSCFQRSKVRAIMINLNPGASSGFECTKCFCRYEDDPKCGELLCKLIKECGTSYIEWISRYGCLLNEYSDGWAARIPGVKWWQGNARQGDRGGRLRWLDQFYGRFGDRSVMPEDVFALELCPYHSKCAPTGMFTRYKKGIDKERFLEFEWQRVFKPAVVAACEDGVPCIACVGKDVIKVLEDCLGDDVDLIRHFDSTEESTRSVWPPTARNEPVNRHYVLYEFRSRGGARWADICQTVQNMPERVWLLGMWTKGSTMPPDQRFKDVEEVIAGKIMAR